MSHAKAIMIRRKAVKHTLVQEHGGKCEKCGYNKCEAALQFHHLDPTKKEFGLSVRGLNRDIDILRKEAEKCILLCANCHAEEHERLPKLDK